MAVSFVVLYNCLVRGLIVQPSGPVYLPLAEETLTQGPEIVGLEDPTTRTSVQLFSCLYGVGQIPGSSTPTTEFNADRRVSFASVDDFSQNGLEINNQIASDYHDNYGAQNPPADSELLTVYPVTTPTAPIQRLPALHTAKRNCHIIKCPKFSHTTYGSDGDRCYEFVNPCFLAVASCKRHNNRLPRLKEVSKKQCGTLKSNPNSK